jgi:hypothetical protein
MADEFSAELADGVAFVAGHDDDGRPVVVRISPDLAKFQMSAVILQTNLLPFR